MNDPAPRPHSLLTQAQRAALHALGITNHDIDILKIKSEEVPRIVRELTADKAQKKLNGGGAPREGDQAAPEAPQPKPDSHEGFIPRELIPTPAAQKKTARSRSARVQVHRQRSGRGGHAK